MHRHKFLQAVERNPAADAKFRQLARDAENLRGAALERIIEDWAVDECLLATRPARDWWIFDQVKQWLRTLATDPPDFGGEEANADSEEFLPVSQEVKDLIADYYSYASVGKPVSLPQELPFRLYAFDPVFSTLDSYEAEMRKSFNTYFENYLSQQPAMQIPVTRVEAHYDWLVRYQMLHHGFSEIAASPGVDYSIAPDSVKTTVFELRRLIDLPSVRGRGRPKKM